MTEPAADTPAVHAREVRVLEGPNLYFGRPAVKVVLAVPGLTGMPDADFASLLGRVGGSRPVSARAAVTAAGSSARQRAVVRLVESLARRLARAIGVTRVGMRVRAGGAPDEVVVAFVWRHRNRATAFGESLAPLLSAVVGGAEVDDELDAAARTVGEATGGERARLITPRIPVVAVTGTNGKTTTTRLIAHIGMTAGKQVAWSSTDGVLAQGRLIESGDYSGPAGARAVLSAAGVELGILETARGGMLLKGLGVTHNDVSVVTNVSADHLGLQGIDTVDQLAEVKAIITKVTRPAGWAVLNGDDPRVWAMRAGTRGRPWVFTLDADSPAIRDAIGSGGRAVTVLDGWVTVIDEHRVHDRLVPVVDLPMTLSGLSVHNVANALAGAAAALAIGLPREAVVEGLRTFAPDDRFNPGRMNVYSVPVDDGSATVVIDLAHNEAGLEALLDVCHGLAAPGGRVRLALGTAGDRTDDILEALGEIAGRRADEVVLAHKVHYLRGRTIEEMERPMRAGLMRVGVAHADSTGTELEGLQQLLAGARDGDVVAVMCHAERSDIATWLAEAGASADDASAIRAKVVRARGEHPAQDRIDALWAMADAEARIAAAARLASDHPDDPVIAYEYGGTFDAAGRPAEAVAQYEAALEGGLREPLRHRCLIQLASTLRNLGRFDEAVARIDEAAAAEPASVGTQMFRAMVLHDAGRATEGLQGLLAVLAAQSSDADVERYRRSLTAYAAGLGKRSN